MFDDPYVDAASISWSYSCDWFAHDRFNGVGGPLNAEATSSGARRLGLGSCGNIRHEATKEAPETQEASRVR